MNVAAILVLLCSTGGLSDPHPRLVAAQNPQLVYESAISLFFGWAEKQGGSAPRPWQGSRDEVRQHDSIQTQLSEARELLAGASLEEWNEEARDLLWARWLLRRTALDAASGYLWLVRARAVRDTAGVRQAIRVAYSLAQACHAEQQKIGGSPAPLSRGSWALASSQPTSGQARGSVPSYQEVMRAFYTWAADHGGRRPTSADKRSAGTLAWDILLLTVEITKEMRRLWDESSYHSSPLLAKHLLMLVALQSAYAYEGLLTGTLHHWDTPGAREAASLAYSLWATVHDEQKKIP